MIDLQQRGIGIVPTLLGRFTAEPDFLASYQRKFGVA